MCTFDDWGTKEKKVGNNSGVVVLIYTLILCVHVLF